MEMFSEGAESRGLVRVIVRRVMSEESSRMMGGEGEEGEMGREGEPSIITISTCVDCSETEKN